MKTPQLWLAGFALLAITFCFANTADAQKKKVVPTKEWSGSVDDEKLLKAAPEVVTSMKGLQLLWTDWKLDGKIPEIDFTKELLVLTTSRGSKLNLILNLDEGKGNLQVLGLGTRDLRPGFRYVLATVSREGIMTVNGKELPKQ